jgi:hypothetical protein
MIFGNGEKYSLLVNPELSINHCPSEAAAVAVVGILLSRPPSLIAVLL